MLQDTMVTIYSQDCCNAVLWGCSNVLLGYAAWTASQRLFPRDTCAQHVRTSVVIWWAAITTVAEALGTGGVLSAYTMLGGVSAVAATWLYMSQYTSAKAGKRASTAVHAVVAADGRNDVASLVAWLGIRRAKPAYVASKWISEWVPGLLWGLGAGVWGIHLIADGLLGFPTEDTSLVYHLPLVDQWIRHRSLYAPQCRHWNHPGGNEVIALWMVAPFSADFLASLTNVPAVLLLALSCYELMKMCGVATSICHCATLMAVAIAPVMDQLMRCGNDVAVAGLFMTCLAYGLRYVQSAGFLNVLCAAVTAGLLAGVKFYALGYAFVAGITVVAAVLSARGARTAVKAAAVLALGALIWAGYWYVRNAVCGGSPLYPVNAGVNAAFEAEMRIDIVRSSLLGNGQADVVPLLVRAMWTVTGPGHFIACIASPVVCAWLLLQGVRWRACNTKRIDGIVRSAIACAVLGGGLVLGITPYAVENIPNTLNQLRAGYTPIRYGLTFLTGTVVAMALLCDDVRAAVACWRPQWRGTMGLTRIPVMLVGGLSLYAFLVPPAIVRPPHWDAELMCAGDLLMIGGMGWAMVTRWGRCHQVALLSALCVAGIGGPACMVWRSQAWHEGFSAFYDRLLFDRVVTEFAEKLPDDTCVCVLRSRPYPFFGARRQFRVCQPLENEITSYGQLREYIRKCGATVVVTDPPEWVGDASNPFGRMILWVAEDPAVFAPVKEGDWLVVWRVQGEAGDGSARIP